MRSTIVWALTIILLEFVLVLLFGHYKILEGVGLLAGRSNLLVGAVYFLLPLMVFPAAFQFFARPTLDQKPGWVYLLYKGLGLTFWWTLFGTLVNFILYESMIDTRFVSLDYLFYSLIYGLVLTTFLAIRAK